MDASRASKTGHVRDASDPRLKDEDDDEVKIVLSGAYLDAYGVRPWHDGWVAVTSFLRPAGIRPPNACPVISGLDLIKPEHDVHRTTK